MPHPAVPRLLLLALAAWVGFVGLAAAAPTPPPPARLHFRPATGYFGDAHPIYWQGQWWLYYLRVPREPFRRALADVHTALAVSRDLIHWEERAVSHSDPSVPWWAIAVFPYQNGLAAIHNSGTGFNMALTDNGTSWTAFPQNPVLSYETATAGVPEPLQCRDPNVFFDPASKLYYLSIAARRRSNDQNGNHGALLVTTSTTPMKFPAARVAYMPGNTAVPECPELFQLNHRTYFIGSWGLDQVGQGRWRSSTSPAGPWQAVPLDALDGSELQAPNSNTDGQRRVMFGWVPTYHERADFKHPEWGGDLAFPREIWADANGQLNLRPVAELTKLRQAELDAAPPHLQIRAGGAAITSSTWTNASGADYAEAWLPTQKPYFEISAEFTPGADCPEAGIIFQRSASEPFPGYAVTINFQRATLELKPFLEPRRTLTFTPIAFTPGTPYRLRVIVDGDLVEAFLNDHWALAGRIHRGVANPRVGLYIQRGACRVADVHHFQLAPFFAPAPSPEINLFPSYAATQPNRGNAVLFPSAGANVYTPFNPVLNFAGPFSLECRVWITPGTGNRKENLVIKGDGDQPGYHYGLNLMPNGSVELFLKSSNDFVGLTSPPGSANATGRWLHILGTVDPAVGRLRLFLDGKQVAEQTHPPFTLDRNNQGALRFGHAAGLPHSNPFFGCLDDVRLWDRAISPEEAATLVTTSPAPNTLGLVAAWDFDRLLWPRDGDQNRAFAPNLVNANPALRAGLYDGALAHAAE